MDSKLFIFNNNNFLGCIFMDFQTKRLRYGCDIYEIMAIVSHRIKDPINGVLFCW